MNHGTKRKRAFRTRINRWWRMTTMKTVTKTVTFEEICREAGFIAGPDKKLNLPATQGTCQDLQGAAIRLCGGEWKPGMEMLDLTITGAGPVWAYMILQHALHGRCARLTYASPNATLVIWSHGL